MKDVLNINTEFGEKHEKTHWSDVMTEEEFAEFGRCIACSVQNECMRFHDMECQEEFLYRALTEDE